MDAGTGGEIDRDFQDNERWSWQDVRRIQSRNEWPN